MNTRVGTLAWYVIPLSSLQRYWSFLLFISVVNRLAPESLADHTVYTTKADVFSFGMVLYEVMTQKVAYEGRNAIHIIKAIDAGERPEISASADPEYAQLVRDCWAQDPKKEIRNGNSRLRIIAEEGSDYKY